MEGGVLYAVVERDPSSKDQRSAGAHNTPSFRPVLSLLSWIVLRYQEEASESIYVCLWVLDASCMVQQMHYIGIAPFGHRTASKNKKNMTHFAHFPRPGEFDPYRVCFPKQSMRQCAPIWSDNRQPPYTSKLEVIRDKTWQPSTCLWACKQIRPLRLFK